MKTVKKILLLTLCLCMVFLTACTGKNKEVKTTTEPESVTESQLAEQTTVQNTTLPLETESQTEAPSSVTVATEAPVTEAPVTEAPVTAAPTTEAQTNGVYTKEQALSILTAAVNKTKGYKGNITVNHKESFNIEEPKVNIGSSKTMGDMATRVINAVKDTIAKPTEEVYSFNNGTATTSEGEKTQLLLPKAAAFTLPIEGVKDATVTDNNGTLTVKLTLNAEETHSLNDIPPYNAASTGYLDLNGKFKIMKITKIDTVYPGSVIEAVIRPDGYVQSAVYTIYMQANTEATGMGMSGSASFSGYQTENWSINW